MSDQPGVMSGRPAVRPAANEVRGVRGDRDDGRLCAVSQRAFSDRLVGARLEPLQSVQVVVVTTWPRWRLCDVSRTDAVRRRPSPTTDNIASDSGHDLRDRLL